MKHISKNQPNERVPFQSNLQNHQECKPALPRTSFFLDAEGRFVVLRDLEGNVVLRDLEGNEGNGMDRDFGFFSLLQQLTAIKSKDWQQKT